jgi:hypothetical protein
MFSSGWDRAKVGYQYGIIVKGEVPSYLWTDAGSEERELTKDPMVHSPRHAETLKLNFSSPERSAEAIFEGKTACDEKIWEETCYFAGRKAVLRKRFVVAKRQSSE